MTDLDKMARELLAAEYEADHDNRAASAIRGRCKLGAPWAAERPAIDAIRKALLTAPPGYKLVPVELIGAFPEINPSNYRPRRDHR